MQIDIRYGGHFFGRQLENKVYGYLGANDTQSTDYTFLKYLFSRRSL